MAASIENRVRFPLEVFSAMRDGVAGASKPMSVRISASDWTPGGLTEDDMFAIARAFAEAGCDLISTSSAADRAGAEADLWAHVSGAFAEAIRNVARIATMAVGAITEPAQINTIIACTARRSRGAGAAAFDRSLFHASRRRLVWRENAIDAAAISLGHGAGVARSRAHARAAIRAAEESQAVAPALSRPRSEDVSSIPQTFSL